MRVVDTRLPTASNPSEQHPGINAQTPRACPTYTRSLKIQAFIQSYTVYQIYFSESLYKVSRMHAVDTRGGLSTPSNPSEHRACPTCARGLEIQGFMRSYPAYQMNISESSYKVSRVHAVDARTWCICVTARRQRSPALPVATPHSTPRHHTRP